MRRQDKRLNYTPQNRTLISSVAIAIHEGLSPSPKGDASMPQGTVKWFNADKGYDVSPDFPTVDPNRVYCLRKERYVSQNAEDSLPSIDKKR
jgi:hypothetical protein